MQTFDRPPQGGHSFKDAGFPEDTRIHRWDYQKSLGNLSGQVVPQRVEGPWLRDTTGAGRAAPVKRQRAD